MLPQMESDNRWDEARDALVGVADHAVKYGHTEIDMRFLNSWLQCQDVKVCVLSTMIRVKPYINIECIHRHQSFQPNKAPGCDSSLLFQHAHIKRVSFAGLTPTRAVLKQILDDHIVKLDAAVNDPAYYDIKPLDVIVITDGIP